MVCDITDLTINPPPTIGIPGVGLPTAIKFPELSLPFDIPEDLLELFNKLSFRLPSGLMKANLSPSYDKNIFDAIKSLLEKFIPFLMFYKFCLPILNLLVCIIEVICSINNPVRFVNALRRLFRVCIPDFLSLFPIFALIIMIISLLLLILQLINYIIQLIKRIIQQIIKNITLLGKALGVSDPTSQEQTDSVLAVTRKIGILLCFLQNLFVIFGAIALIIEIFKQILSLESRIPPCAGDNSSNVDSDGGCCPPEVCPDFIRNNTEIKSTTGKFRYHNKVIENISATVIGATESIFPVLRNELFQLYDDLGDPKLAFINVNGSYDAPDSTFWPEGTVYNKNSKKDKVPYTVDLKFEYDPNNVFFNPYPPGDPLNRNLDPKGKRFVIVRDCIILAQPENNLFNPDLIAYYVSNGVVLVEGGKVYEIDEITPVNVNGVQATLNTLFSIPTTTTTQPLDNSGSIEVDAEYIWKINHYVLYEKSIITAGCIPLVAIDKDFVNATLSNDVTKVTADLSSALNSLVDFSAVADCVFSAIEEFKKDITIDSANKLEADCNACLNDAYENIEDVVKDLIDSGVSVYKSDFTIDPALQFTTQTILVKVVLNDSSGNNVATGLTEEIANNIISKLKAEISFGQITVFTYDGIDSFFADISSSKAGTGEIKITYNGDHISILTIPEDLNQPITSVIKALNYEFIDAIAGIGNDEGQPRRDARDVSIGA